jgi:hypothetical protein
MCVVGKPVISMDYFSHLKDGIDAHTITMKNGNISTKDIVFGQVHTVNRRERNEVQKPLVDR